MATDRLLHAYTVDWLLSTAPFSPLRYDRVDESPLAIAWGAVPHSWRDHCLQKGLKVVEEEDPTKWRPDLPFDHR